MSAKSLDITLLARVESVFGDGSRGRGTAFLVARNLALTAFHVVGQRNTGELAVTVELDFDGLRVAAKVVGDRFDPEADWALLRCRGAPDRVPLPLAELEGDRQPLEVRWSTFGFPQIGPPGGMAIGGAVRMHSISLGAAEAIQLFADEASAGQGPSLGGLSGAPVYLDGAVVGLIRRGLTESDGRSRAGTIYACPVTPIIERCDELPRPDSYWGLPGLPGPPGVALPTTPFRYLEHYSSKEAQVFFGRGNVIRKLYDHCIKTPAPPVLLFYGQAGAGKSSVLSAGLGPRLAWHHRIVYRRREPDRSLFQTAIAALASGENDTQQDLTTAWRNAESEQPVVLILDQIEEAFIESEAAGRRQLDELAEAIAAWPGGSMRGRLLLSFRKEWFSEVEASLEDADVPFSKVFLRPLERQAIREIVEGIQSTRTLRDFYQCYVEPELADILATSLAADEKSPIAPTLQVLLTKMWERAKEGEEEEEELRLTTEIYREVAKDGAHLDDFLRGALEKFADRFGKAARAGLDLDLLDFHTSPLSTSQTRSADQIQDNYGQLRFPIEQARTFFVNAYVLSASGTGTAAVNTRLAHDTLGPLVRKRYEASVKVGQVAHRILAAKALASTGASSPLSASELRLVESGLSATRRPDESGQQLLRRSKLRRLRNRGLAAVAAVGVAALVMTFFFFGSTVRHSVHYRSISDTWDRAFGAATAELQAELGAEHARTLHCAWFQAYAAGLMIRPTSVLAGAPADQDFADSYLLLGKQAAGEDREKQWLRIDGEGIQGISDPVLFARALKAGRAKVGSTRARLPFPELFDLDDARATELFAERTIRGGFAHIYARYNLDTAFGSPSTEGSGEYKTECSTSLLLVEYEAALVVAGAPNGDCRETQNHYILFKNGPGLDAGVTGDWRRLRQAPLFPDVFRGNCADI